MFRAMKEGKVCLASLKPENIFIDYDMSCKLGNLAEALLDSQADEEKQA